MHRGLLSALLWLPISYILYNFASLVKFCRQIFGHPEIPWEGKSRFMKKKKLCASWFFYKIWKVTRDPYFFLHIIIGLSY